MSNTAPHKFVTSLKRKVKSCEHSTVNDMVRAKFVFMQDLTVRERLLREDNVTLEKAIPMARASEASEASKGQIKMVDTKEQNTENPSVNEI